MIWARWRERLPQERLEPRSDAFQDLVEEAPLMALLLDRNHVVVAANADARAFFDIPADALPASLVDVTREGRLLEVLGAGHPEEEVRLSHRQRTVQTRLVPGPRPGDTLMFIVDVTELRRLQTVRQEFVANLSHELKTPLTSLRLAAESLEGNPPAEARRRFAQRVMKEADHLSIIVANLRQLAEIEEGRLSYQLSRFEVSELVDEVVDRLKLDRPLLTHVPAGLTVAADRAKLAQALSNLLDNAAKFSPPGTPIEVRAELAGDELHLGVRDHGPGISPEHWSRVFERFYKVDPARPREAGGSGLGLAITKHLALAQGGRVWTEAATDGGQVFVIALPAGRTMVKAQRD